MLNIESNKDYETIPKEGKLFYLTLNHDYEIEDEWSFKVDKSIQKAQDTNLIDFMAHIYHDKDNRAADEQSNIIDTLIHCHILVMFKKSINIDDVRALFEENSGSTVYCETIRSGLNSSRRLIHVSEDAILKAKAPYQYGDVIPHNCIFREMVTPLFWEQKESEEDDNIGITETVRLLEQQRQEHEQIDEEEFESLEDNFSSFVDDIDPGAELDRIRPRKRVESEPLEQSEESKKIDERIKQPTEAEKQAKADALAEQNRGAEAKRKEKELFDKEQERKRQQKIKDDKKQAELEAKQKVIDDKEKVREHYEKIIQSASMSDSPVSDRKIEKFKEVENDYRLNGKPTAKDPTFKYSSHNIHRAADIRIADEDRERKQEPELQQQEDEPDLE